MNDSPKIDEPGEFGLKSSSAEKSNQQEFVTYSNFTTQEYSAAINSSNGIQGTLSHNAFDELKLQQLQYQQVFQKHNQKPPGTSSEESRQIKLSPAGIPLDDSEYESDEKTLPSHFYSHHHPPHRLDDGHILDDGENSQIDLVEYASKN